MNGGFQTSRDEIGIDPTTVEVIDTLDFNDNNNPNNPKKDKTEKVKTMLTKILFAFGLLALMGLVAFGIYFYLDLGKKKMGEGDAKVKLKDITSYQGIELPADIFEYGNFEKIDVSQCELDITTVDAFKPGTYEYSVVCEGAKYTGKITIIEKYAFEITSNIIYKTSNDVLIAAEFISGSENNTYELKDKAVNNYLYTPGGPYLVEVNVNDITQGKEGMVQSVLYVTEASPRVFLKCTSDVITSEAPNSIPYKVVDTFAFDTFKNYLNVPSRLHVFEIDEKQYIELIDQVDNGKITLNNTTGYMLRNDIDHILRMTVDFDDEKLFKESEKELKTYNDIKEYYEDKGYECE